MTQPGHDDKGWPLHKYTVVESLSRGDLCEKVCMKIAAGWRCQGGVCAFEYHQDEVPTGACLQVCYIQAMVRDEVTPEEQAGKSGFYGGE
jgi:hypothetical protein